MTSTAPPPTGHAVSADGTPIAYWSTGNGPPLVVVHGAPADHTRWRPLLPYLEPHFTVYAIDRRGRGASGDAPEYSLEREFEDVAAVVDAVASISGSAVRVYGHSYGGLVAFGGATLTPTIDRLVLYEGWPVTNPDAFALPEGLEGRMDVLLESGDHEAVVEALFREVEHMSDDDMAAFKAAPSWPGRVAAAPTLTRELRGMVSARLDSAVARTITASVLLVTGENSSDPNKPDVEAVAAALTSARILVLEDQEHVADVLDPEGFAARVVPFLHADA